MRQRVPIQKLTAPAEVAREVAHLCDPQTQQITGTVVLMDGGLSLR
jgi:NAD(P)-dependent dehydrogenase (short-subunit alcohol dehydrogenase family)